MDPIRQAEVEEVVARALAKYDDGFEERLASAFQKALDTVEAENAARIRSLEEDMASVLKHLGMTSHE